jgi:transposase InsO family protein
MTYPLVEDLAADAIPVAVTCRVLEFSQAGVLWLEAQPAQSARRRRRLPDQRHTGHPPRRPDVPGRRCTTTWSARHSPPDARNRLWLTDITEHPTAEGKLYLCAIKDVYSGRIVGYSIDTRMKAALAVSALRNAVWLRDPPDRRRGGRRTSAASAERSTSDVALMDVAPACVRSLLLGDDRVIGFFVVGLGVLAG